ncbi:MAG TPA: hypothetical protein VFZ42_05560 [Chitinophagaceae bacterium]
MKKTIGIVGSFALSMMFLSATAQEPTQPTTTPPTTTPSTTWDYKKNPTVDSINAKYKDKMIPARTPMTVEQIYPVLGQYETTVNTTDAPSVKVTLDEQNKGIVWIEGLPQGKVKAMLRKSPSTYKIPAQKTEDGKDVPEGTLVYDKDANTMNINIGTPYNTEDPLSVFSTAATEQAVVVDEVKTKTKGSKTKVKTKKVKPWTYTGTKIVVETAATVPVNQ